MNYIVFDNFHDNNGYIVEALRKKGVDIEEIYSPDSKYKWIAWLKGVLNAILKSSSGDTLIFWYDFQGIIFWEVCKLLWTERRIIILNLLLKNKPTFKNKIVSYLYKSALQANNVEATVTSLEYGEALNSQLRIKSSYMLLHDVYPFDEKEETEYKNYGTKVFCGGNNGRDWELAIKIGQSMPNVQFTLVMPTFIQKYYSKIKISDNIHILGNVSLVEFNKLLQESSIVMLPLNTDAPAGLIVIFQAASQQKTVITTSTPVTKEYIDNKTGVLCENNIDQFRKEIEYHLQHPDIAKAKGKALYNKLRSECSKELYTSKLYNILLHNENRIGHTCIL